MFCCKPSYGTIAMVIAVAESESHLRYVCCLLLFVRWQHQTICQFQSPATTKIRTSEETDLSKEHVEHQL